MPVYEYECADGHRSVHMCHVWARPASVACRLCGESARRVFSVPRVRTADNNPYRRFQPILGFDASTRAGAERAMAERGTVLASQADRDVGERRASERRIAAKRELHELEGRYRALPQAAKEYVTQSEYVILTPEERAIVTPDKILPDPK